MMASTIQTWCTTLGLGPGGHDRQGHPGDAGVHAVRRAVAGVFIQCSAKMNRTVATM